MYAKIDRMMIYDNGAFRPARVVMSITRLRPEVSPETRPRRPSLGAGVGAGQDPDGVVPHLYSLDVMVRTDTKGVKMGSGA